MRGRRRVAAAALVLGGFATSGALAYADAPKTGGGYGYGEQPPSEECKPGWGFGDKNHCHSGPPGLQNNPHSKSKGHSGSGQ
jgi:hypothetical protein